MSDANWRATTDSNEVVTGETYKSIVNKLEKTDTEEIWIVQYHDSCDTWTPIDKLQVKEGQAIATSKYSV